MPLRLRTLLLLATTLASFPSIATPMTEQSPKAGAPTHIRCAQVRPGMRHNDVITVMGRPADSTLYGHSEGSPDGNTPPGSYAIDVWDDTDLQSRRVISSVYSSGGQVESVDCGRPVDDSPPSQPPSGAQD
jgi:hypothetical protein